MNVSETSTLFTRLKLLCKEFPRMNYENLDNNRLAVFIIGLLNDNAIPRTHETISVAMFLTFPDKFSLPGFPQYPDTERTNRTLLQLGKKYRNWAHGNRQVGYNLNYSGKHILKQTIELLKNPSAQKVKRKTTRPRTRDVDADIIQIESTNLFKKHYNGQLDQSDEFDFWELMQAFPSTPKKALRNRIDLLKNYSKLADREDILNFLSDVQSKYKDLLRG